MGAGYACLLVAFLSKNMPSLEWIKRNKVKALLSMLVVIIVLLIFSINKSLTTANSTLATQLISTSTYPVALQGVDLFGQVEKFEKNLSEKNLADEQLKRQLLEIQKNCQPGALDFFNKHKIGEGVVWEGELIRSVYRTMGYLFKIIPTNSSMPYFGGDGILTKNLANDWTPNDPLGRYRVYGTYSGFESELPYLYLFKEFCSPWVQVEKLEKL